MPNVGHIDYLPQHWHSPADFQGLLTQFFPPVFDQRGTTVGPSTSSSTYAVLEEMEAALTPPAWFPLWEAKLDFSGEFEPQAVVSPNRSLLLRFTLDGTPTAGNFRSFIGPDITARFTAMLSDRYVIPGGVESTLAVEWASADNVTEWFGTTTIRRFRVQLTPYNRA